VSLLLLLFEFSSLLILFLVVVESLGLQNAVASSMWKNFFVSENLLASASQLRKINSKGKSSS